MNNRFLLVLLCIALSGGCDEQQQTALPQASPKVTASSNNKPVEDFALLDHRGDFHRLYYYSDARAIVLFVQGNGCPVARNALPALKKLRDEFASKGVVFLLLNANLQDQRSSIAREADAFDIDFPILVDETQLIAESLNIARTGEAILINPASWNILYRGPIDDRLSYEFQKDAAVHHYLHDALNNHLQNKPITVASRSLVGCIVPLLNKTDDNFSALISYSEHIAPLLRKKCIVCHRDGGIGPWSMSDYNTIRGWSPMMREVIRTRRMPPWQADPAIGVFKNDLSLSIAETQTLVHWIEAGAPRDAAKPDPLQQPLAQTAHWPMGEPDLILSLDEQQIPATGLIDYRYIFVKIPLPEDIWLRAVDLRPSNRKVMHHAFAFLKAPQKTETSASAADARLKAEDVIATYAPGINAEQFPANTGRFVAKGSELVFELHYTATGRPETDRPVLGLYFARQPPEHGFRVDGLWNDTFQIPPHDKHFEVSADYEFSRQVLLYGLMPHMHYRGKQARFIAYYPDGSAEILLSVPHYSFNWQRYYNLQKPRELPAGTRIVLKGAFDNSAQNRTNPDPNKTVGWGPYSSDEMLAGYLTYRYLDESEQ